MGNKVVSFVKDIALDSIASVFIAIALNVYTVPNQIVAGGVNGVATILNFYTGLPIGTMSLFMNIPLMIWGYKAVGKDFIISTLRVLAVSAFFIDYLLVDIPAYTGDLLLASVFGGIAYGVGLGIVIIRGTSTGGSDILVRIIKMRVPHLSFGSIIIATDLLVVAAASIAYENLEVGMYAMVVIYISGEVIDKMMKGADVRTLVLVVSMKAQEIANSVVHDLQRSATLVDAKGAFSGKATELLVCAVSKQEFHKLKKLIRAIDPMAFTIVADAGEILGEGFKSIHHD